MGANEVADIFGFAVFCCLGGIGKRAGLSELGSCVISDEGFNFYLVISSELFTEFGATIALHADSNHIRSHIVSFMFKIEYTYPSIS